MGEGSRLWIFPDGYLPAEGSGGSYVGHEAICLLNTGSEDAQLWLDFYFEDREPQLGVPVSLPARRCLHLRTDKPIGGFSLPRETPYALRLRSSLPVVAQYSRLDATQPNLAFMAVLGWTPGQVLNSA